MTIFCGYGWGEHDFILTRTEKASPINSSFGIPVPCGDTTDVYGCLYPNYRTDNDFQPNTCIPELMEEGEEFPLPGPDGCIGCSNCQSLEFVNEIRGILGLKRIDPKSYFIGERV